MKVLVLYNYFNYQYKFIPRFINKFLRRFEKTELNSLIKHLRKIHKENLEIKIINAEDRKLDLHSDIHIEDLSSLRIELEHNEYLNILDKVTNNTKQNLTAFYNNLDSVKLLKEMHIAKPLEFSFVLFLNELFGSFELIKRVLLAEEFDKIILFNCNKFCINIVRSLNSIQERIKVYNSKIFLKNIKILNYINAIFYTILTIGVFFKRILVKSNLKKSLIKKNDKQQILFLADSENQIRSIRPVYEFLKKIDHVNPIHYRSETYLSLRNITRLLKHIFYFRKLIYHYKKYLSRNMKYDSLRLGEILKIYYSRNLFIELIKGFNVWNNLKKFTKKMSPNIVIITNDFLTIPRLISIYFKSNSIPTLHIPHAAVPIIDEMITENSVEYFALGSEFEREYYMGKGVLEEKIEITGIPRYEYFHKNQFQILDEVIDIFDGRKYNFSKHDFTILLTTNPIDDRSNEKIITATIESLNKLNLIKNLIIKLHPREDGKIHKRILKRFNLDTIIVKDYKILNLIKSCDLLLSQKSTTILEAMLVGTPIIVLDFINKEFNETSKYLFLNKKFVLSVKEQPKLTQKIKDLIINNELRENYRQNLIKNAKKFISYDPENPPIQKISELIMK
ncbi:MAG: hypothetical protein ACFE94_14160, partial [Candidatus Hodarchaeota archaeon]